MSELISSSESSQLPFPKKAKQEVVDKIEIPSSVIAVFLSQDGERAGSGTIDVPVSSTVKQLEMLVNTLLQNESPLPYAFYVNDMEIDEDIKSTISQLESLEDILTVSFQPLSVYKVRPITRCAETMTGHTDAVTYVQYSPDGKQLASGGGDMAIRFWNTSSLMPYHTCTGHRNHILAVVWALDSSVFVSADKNGEIRVWDPVTGKQVGATLCGHKKYVTCMSFEPFHADPTCTRLASASKDQTIKIWNIKTCLCETTISGHLDAVEAVKWGGNGLLYTCSRDRTIKVWDVDGHGKSQQKLVRTLSGHAHRINTLALNCDYALRTGAFQLGDNLKKNGDAADSLSLSEKQQKALEKYRVVVGSEGERLVSGSDDFTMFLWSPQEGKSPITRMTGHQQLVVHISFSPDGRYLASASFDKKVKLWCGKTGRFIATFNGHVGAVYQVSWSADSNYIVSASKDSTVKLWSPKNPKKAVGTLPGHEDEVYALDWSPNGTQVASGSKDRSIKIWFN